MADTKYIGQTFEPSPGHILLQIPEKQKTPGTITLPPKKSEGLTSEAKIGKVLKIGEHFVNDFGVERHKPCKVGDTILFVSEINQNYLEIEFKQYPVVRFGAILGVISNE